MPFPLFCWKLIDFFQQFSLFQFAKSLLTLDLQLSEVSCSYEGDVAYNIYPIPAANI